MRFDNPHQNTQIALSHCYLHSSDLAVAAEFAQLLSQSLAANLLVAQRPIDVRTRFAR